MPSNVGVSVTLASAIHIQYDHELALGKCGLEPLEFLESCRHVLDLDRGFDLVGFRRLLSLGLGKSCHRNNQGKGRPIPDDPDADNFSHKISPLSSESMFPLVFKFYRRLTITVKVG